MQFAAEKLPRASCQQASPGFLRLRSGQALRLRATSAVSGDESVRRFAQDDGLVWGLAMQLVGYAEARKDLKCRSLSAERLTD